MPEEEEKEKEQQPDKICRQVRHEEDPEPELAPLPALTREAIVKADDKPLLEVRIEEWGGMAYIRTLTGKERDDFTQLCMNAEKRPNKIDIRGIRARLVILALCDVEGRPLFADDDVKLLNEKSARVLEYLFQTISRHNGLTKEALEELVGNSESGLNASSG